MFTGKSSPETMVFAIKLVGGRFFFSIIQFYELEIQEIPCNLMKFPSNRPWNPMATCSPVPTGDPCTIVGPVATCPGGLSQTWDDWNSNRLKVVYLYEGFHMYLYVFTCVHMYLYVFICIHMKNIMGFFMGLQWDSNLYCTGDVLYGILMVNHEIYVIW